MTDRSELRVELFQSPKRLFRRREWWWRAVHTRNGNIMAGSTEGYFNYREAERAINTLKAMLPIAEVVVLGDDGR